MHIDDAIPQAPIWSAARAPLLACEMADSLRLSRHDPRALIAANVVFYSQKRRCPPHSKRACLICDWFYGVRRARRFWLAS